MKVAGEQNLQRCLLGMKTNFALEGNRDPKHLARMRHADIALELDSIIKTALDKICAAERMLKDGDTSTLNIAFGDTNSFVSHSQLRQKTSLDVALKIFGINVDSANKSTTFKERVTHAVCSY